MKKHQRLKNQTILKEQYRLVKVENVLTKLLSQVNESINELKVEELHLKSSLVEHYTTNPNDDQPSTSAQAALRLNIPLLAEKEHPISMQQSNNTIDMEGIEQINKQMLALESLLVPLNKKNYNEQEEEDDDDDSKDDDFNPHEISESDNDEFREFE